MRILVTGAAGFVGHHVCTAMVDRGHDVVATDKRPIEALDGRCQRLVKDMRALSVHDLRPGVDAVLHLATGKPDYRPDGLSDAALYESVLAETVEGTRRVYDVAEAAGARRFIHISSMTVYPGPLPADVRAGTGALDSRPESRGIYAHSKVLAEMVIQKLAASREHRPEICILRFALVCGPGMGHGKPTLDRELLLRAALISTGKVLPLGIVVGIGRPNHGAPLLHVQDLLRGLLALIEQDTQSGRLRIWDVESGAPPRKRDLLDAFSTATGRRRVQIWIPRPIAMAGARAVEGIFRLRGRRPRLPYRIGRAYEFNASNLQHAEFWRDVGVEPGGDVKSCLQAATTEPLFEPMSAKAAVA